MGEVLTAEDQKATSFFPGVAGTLPVEEAKLNLTLEGTKNFFGRQCAVFKVDLKMKAGSRAPRGGQGRRGGEGRRGGARRRSTPEQQLSGTMIVGVSDRRLYKLDLTGKAEDSSTMERGERVISRQFSMNSRMEYLALPFAGSKAD